MSIFEKLDLMFEIDIIISKNANDMTALLTVDLHDRLKTRQTKSKDRGVT